MATTRLFPVLRQGPAVDRGPEGRTPLKAQSAWARAALSESLRLSGLDLPEPWAFDERGAPRPANGVIWSLTHKPLWVGAVCAPEGLSPLGIGVDVEPVKERDNPRIFDYVAGEREWGLAGERSPESFFRLWTAKEAAAKALGLGLTMSPRAFEVSLAGENQQQGTVSHGKNRLTVCWRVVEDKICTVAYC